MSELDDLLRRDAARVPPPTTSASQVLRARIMQRVAQSSRPTRTRRGMLLSVLLIGIVIVAVLGSWVPVVDSISAELKPLASLIDPWSALAVLGLAVLVTFFLLLRNKS